jgi:glucose-1-phosphate cytidylyltransferase
LKVVILAGGFGTRLTEETELRPKPLIEIGSKPILWHVMKIFEASGYGDFVICCGYKGQLIKSYFVNYFTENYDITVNLDRHSVEFLGQPSEKWKVTLVDTGLDTLTGGRIKRIAPYVADETFCLTYGDGVARLDIGEIVRFHRKHGRKATVTAVPAPGRFGVLELADNGNVQSFREKPDNEVGWINGGFFVCEPSVFDYIDGDATSWERTPLERLAREGELMAFRHTGFWKPMDTLRDKRELEELWANGKAPWKTW